ncbi:MAG TPA: ABC transporter permease subunit [Gemmatimonadales bacterium]|nr:ABC transporter permease subunit [Gemmatimonadales bacterium]
MTRNGLLRAGLLCVLALSAAAPLVLLVAASVGRAWFFPALLPTELGLESWRDAFAPDARLAGAAATSLVLALGVGAVALGVAVPVGRALAGLAGWPRRLAAALVFLPVAVPPIALATGLQVTLLRLGLGGTLVGVLLAHAVPAAGYATLYALGVFTAYDRRLDEQARTLGAPPLEVLRRVTLPVLRRPLLEIFALAALVSWAQVPLTLVIGGGTVRTLPVEVLAYVRAGQDRWAATGALLLVLPALLALGPVVLGARRTEAVAL